MFLFYVMVCFVVIFRLLFVRAQVHRICANKNKQKLLDERFVFSKLDSYENKSVLYAASHLIFFRQDVVSFYEREAEDITW